MDRLEHGNTWEKVVQKHHEEKLKQEGKEGLQAKQQEVTTSPASPPSASSSPSHEFSFTISVRSSSTPAVHDKTRTPHNSFAIDLTPADDIFFHGHLLPLHLLSHLPVSPRSSINSLDSFTLPIGELLDDQGPDKVNSNGCITSNDSENGNSNISGFGNTNKNNTNQSNNSERRKPKSFSLFRRRNGSEVVRGREEDKDKQKTKLRFDLNRLLKRYVRMVRPLLFFKGRRDNIRLQAFSFSGNLSWRNKRDQLRGRRGEYSAPASMRTSPTNSGLLVATPTLRPSTSDSTMEELQAAIQAAIAHCKNSIAAEEKITM